MTTRRLAAILAADVVGFSTIMEKDEEGTLAQIKALQREIIEPKVHDHHGRVVKTTGDGILVEFASPVEAVRCALGIQDSIAAGPLQLRIGINLGDIIIEDDGDVYGDGVNVAARLEALCDPGGVVISGKVFDEVEGKIDASFESRGEQQVKNITRPVRVYARAQAKPTRTGAPSKSLPLPDKPSIAVLPFTNMSGDPDQDYFADGVVEDIITALSRVRWFFVIARNSSFTYRGRAVDVRQVGRDLGARYVLEGSIRKAGNRIRITGQLIVAATGRHIWADKFDGSLEDIFELQDQITESVVGALEPNLRLAEVERARVKPTDSLDAYDLFLRALPHHDSMTRTGLEEALNLLHRAIELDPGYALAKAYAAFTITTIKGQGWATERDIREGARLAREALAESRDDATVLALAGMAVTYLDRGFDAGVAALDRAMSLNPMSALVVSRNAYVRVYNGDTQTAIEQFQRAIRLSPLDPDMGFWLNSLGFCYVALGQFDQAVAFSEKSTRETPTMVPTWRKLAITMAHAGRLPEARSALKRMLELSPGHTIRQARSGMFFRDPRHAELYLEGLRLAGLPE